MRTALSNLPPWAKKPLRPVRNICRQIQYYGRRRFCPICGKSSRRFLDFGANVKREAQCFNCGSLERHRLLWLYFQMKTDLFDGKSRKMLHIAPEPWLESKLKPRFKNGYLTADLLNPRAMVRMDITNIQYPDES